MGGAVCSLLLMLLLYAQHALQLVNHHAHLAWFELMWTYKDAHLDSVDGDVIVPTSTYPLKAGLVQTKIYFQ